jgi:hypothetical protein
LAVAEPGAEIDQRSQQPAAETEAQEIGRDIRAPLKIPTRNFDRVESRYQDIWIRGM